MSEEPAGGGRRPLRVVALVDSLGSGGAERVAVELITRLDGSRFERTICLSRSPREDALWVRQRRVLAEAGVRVMTLGRRRRLSILAWRPLWRALRREQVDVLHSHMFGSNLWGAIIGHLARVPVVIAHEHGWSDEGNSLRMFLDREVIARGVNAFVAVSEQDRRKMIERARIPADRVILVRNGSPANGAPSGRDVRADLAIEPGAPVLGTVCVLRREKALEVMFEAVALVRAEFPDVRLLVAGEGPEGAKLEGKIGELGLDGTVTMLGLRADVADVITAFDVALCSSDSEGAPLSIMEYMEAARPIVATRVGGIPDLVEDGQEGVLVPPRAPAAMAEAIVGLLRDPGARVEMGARGRERRDREFSIEAMVARFDALYHDLRDRVRDRVPASTLR
jgi:glycosyltransferase involved in cell wall biosynthesis